MKRKLSLMCVLTLCAGLLTACGKENRVIARYDTFIRYSLGADGKLEYAGEKDGYEKYTLSYRDHAGTMRGEKTTQQLEFEPLGSNKPEKEEEAYCLRVMETIVNAELQEIAQAEMNEKVLMPCFPGYNGMSGGDGYGSQTLCPMPGPLITSDNYQGKEINILEKHIGEGGWQLCTADLQSIACDENWYISVPVVISDEADQSAYITKMKNAVKTFREITAEPQNYLFYLQRHTKDGDKIIYMDAAIRGEQVTDEALLNGKPGAVLDKMLAALRDEVSHW